MYLRTNALSFSTYDCRNDILNIIHTESENVRGVCSFFFTVVFFILLLFSYQDIGLTAGDFRYV